MKLFHRPINASLAILKRSDYVPEADALIDFLTGPKAVAVFQKYGFRPIPTPANSRG